MQAVQYASFNKKHDKPTDGDSCAAILQLFTVPNLVSQSFNCSQIMQPQGRKSEVVAKALNKMFLNLQRQISTSDPEAFCITPWA